MKPVYVECMGGIWKLSRAKYKKLLRQVIATETFDLDLFGKMVALDPIKVTDMDADEAKEKLKELNRE